MERKTAIVILSTFVVLACGSLAPGGQKQETPGAGTPVAKGWPEQWNQRTLFRGEQAFVYAQKKAAANEGPTKKGQEGESEPG